jgi:hypothetical protein
MMSIEAEKDSNARYSPASIAEAFKAFGELDEISDVICTSGWWPRDRYERLHGSDVHPGYRGVTKNDIIVGVCHEALNGHIFCSLRIMHTDKMEPNPWSSWN